MSPRTTGHTPGDLPEDACWWDGKEWPEHDFPPEGEGDECRRCGTDVAGPDE